MSHGSGQDSNYEMYVIGEVVSATEKVRENLSNVRSNLVRCFL